jgi:hypothetical protein
MSRHLPDAAQIHRLIHGLSAQHVLRNSPRSYVDDFVAAALAVYDPAEREKTLQHKFFIPDESNYNEDAYYQSASELTVSHYIKQKEQQHLLANYERDKKLNRPSRKDVDNHFEVGPTKVSVEVKCPSEEKQAPYPGNITLQTVGRAPDLSGIRHIQQTLQSSVRGTNFVLGKNPDLRMKDCLQSANEKFNCKSGVDDLNVLFLSAGTFSKISQWYFCLHGPEGLFTSYSFAPEVRARNVDVLVLSNLRYRHEEARDYPAWTLDNVLLLPVLNPHGRSNCTEETIHKGLCIFQHYLTEFARFHSRGELMWEEPRSAGLAGFERQIKPSCFVMEYLTASQFSRCFPTIDRSKHLKYPGQ